MTRLFRSKSCSLVGTRNNNMFNSKPQNYDSTDEEDEVEEEEEWDEHDHYYGENPISTPLVRIDQGSSRGHNRNNFDQGHHHHQFSVLAILVTALRKSIVTCSVETDDVSSSSSSSSMDISGPTEVRHVSHVTFDRFNGFLGLPVELQPEVPRRVPSASKFWVKREVLSSTPRTPKEPAFTWSGYPAIYFHKICSDASVFGVSAKSMQCSYDERGNSVPTILLMMQKRLYTGGGLQAEGIFRINAENSQEEHVRNQLNRGLVPRGIDIHCLAGLIKAWLRELPTGVLDSLSPEQVMHCNTEDECTQLVTLLPPTEAVLLDWAINLMADVVEHEHQNKMNARNIAMVFAPNMTQMADPLTALIHAVQVMNLLKTLIMKTLREREESATKARLLSTCSGSPCKRAEPHSPNSNSGASCEQTLDSCSHKEPAAGYLLRTATLDRQDSDSEEKFWSFQKKSDGEDEYESLSGGSTPAMYAIGALEKGCKVGYNNGEGEGILERLNLRKGVRKLCSHPVFQLSKSAKKSADIGIVNTRSGDGEACA